jgi:hypothetical protein
MFCKTKTYILQIYQQNKINNKKCYGLYGDRRKKNNLACRSQKNQSWAGHMRRNRGVEY